MLQRASILGRVVEPVLKSRQLIQQVGNFFLPDKVFNLAIDLR
jgi:hypothetical protein